MKIGIAPSILAADFCRLGEEVRAVEAAAVDLIHVDVMDGRFVPPITIGAPVVRNLKRVARVGLDVHLMVEDPDRHIDSFVDAGAACVTIHAEAATHLDRTIRYIKSRGIKAGVALNPGTPLAAIYYVLGLVDMVLVMSVNPGYGGQTFLDYNLAKIEALRSEIKHRKLSTLIEVDGGIKLENVGKVAKAGADIIVAGTAIFNSGDYPATVQKMRALAANAVQAK